MQLKKIVLMLGMLCAPLSAQAQTVTAKSFRIEGSKAFSEAQLLSLVADAKGRELGPDEREELARRITSFYRSHGYQRAHAIVPQQDFAGGQILFYITTRASEENPRSAAQSGVAMAPAVTQVALEKAPGAQPVEKIRPVQATSIKPQVVVPQKPEEPLHSVEKRQGGDQAQLLLQRAKEWEARGREDLARGVLEKLFLSSPDDPDAIAEMGILEAKRGSGAGAQKMLERLRRVSPAHPGVHRIEDFLRLLGPDKDKLREARLMVKSGRKPEAIAAFRALYPNGPPDSDLALEYWQLVASTPEGWESGRDALEKLTKEYPDNLRYRIALARHETSRLPLNRRALQVLIEMSKSPEFGREAHAAWRNAISRLDDDPIAIPLLNDYLQSDPADTALKNQLEAAIRTRDSRAHAAEEKRILLADPDYQAEIQGLALLDDGKLDEAEKMLARAVSGRPQDADAWGGMGLIRLRQGHHAEAEAYFKKALQIDPERRRKWSPLVDAAEFWLLLRIAGEAKDAGEYKLAQEKLHAALQVKPNDADALAALGRAQLAAGETAQAEASFMSALAHEAENRSALSGLFSLYLANDRVLDARRRFASLSSRQKESLGSALNGIEAAILKAEAEKLQSAGKTDEATVALERAVKLDPEDPWLVYSLARLYAKSGKTSMGEPLFAEYLSRHEGDATGLYALALFQSGTDRDQEALATLEQIAANDRNEKTSGLQKSLLVKMKLLAAKANADTGEQKKAEQALRDAEKAAGSDAGLGLDIARSWADMGNITHAREIATPLAARQDLPVSWHFDYANFLLKHDLQEDLDQEIASIGKMPLSQPEAKSLAALRQSALVQKSEKLRLAGKYDEARLVVSYPLTVNPDSIPLLLVNARISFDVHMWPEAEKDYLHVLKLDPRQAEAISGLLLLYVKNDRIDEARAVVSRLSPEDIASLADSRDSITRTMRQGSDDLLSRGNAEEAGNLLRLAIVIDPQDPWLRYDLARIYARAGMYDKGDALFDELLARRPDDPTALYVYALFQSGQDRDVEAMKTLEKIGKADRAEKIVKFQKSLWVRIASARAKAFFARGDAGKGKQALLEAEKAADGDADLTTGVASAWADAGFVPHALDLMSRLEKKGGLPASWHIGYADFLLSHGSGAEFDREMSVIKSLGELAPEDARALAQLQESVVIGKADALRRQGKLDEARKVLSPWLAAKPKSVDLLLANARISRDANLWGAAEADYLRVLDIDPLKSEARHGLAQALHGEGKLLDALRWDEQWILHKETDDTETRLSLVRVLADLEDYSRADAELAALRGEFPDNSEAKTLARDLSVHDSRTLSRIRRVQTAAGPELVVTSADAGSLPAGSDSQYEFRKRAKGLDAGNNWILAAADWHSRSGTPGYSQLDMLEVPLEWRAPENAYGKLFYQANMVSINAGMVNVNTSWQAKNFGSLALCLPNCPSGLAGQAVRGASFVGGLSGDDWKVDIGSTGVGFPVQNVIGGVMKKADLGPLGLTFELSRRPITSSLLSYAGTRDPRTGQLWGGVVATGPRLGLSLDQGGEFGAWLSLGYHKLTGLNVQDNNRMQLMTGGYWRIINEDDQLLSLGLTGMFWKYQRDAGEYTFGHGGYYSPQRYTSLSVPLTYAQRFDRLAYSLRGSVSYSQSRFDAAPYFPTNAAYQAASGLTYAANSGPGSGYSFNAAMEYQADPSLFVGGKLELERAAYYAPNRLIFYMRAPLDRPGAEPVPLQPDPVIPSSQY